MVRSLKYTRAFFLLVRWSNLLIVAVTMYLLRHFIVLPILESNGYTSLVSHLYFGLIVLATLCIAGAGYVINDYFDRKADLINRPGKVILGRILSRRAGMIWHIILNTVGIGLGVFASYKIGAFKHSIIFVFMSGLLWFYSTTYKRQVLLGNLVVAFMVAMVPLLVLLYEVPLLWYQYKNIFAMDPAALTAIFSWITGYAIFAFVLSLAREIVKDLEDFEGDFAFGRQTIPIRWGAAVARTIALSTVIVSLLAIIVVALRFTDSFIVIAYIALAVVLPVIWLLVILWKALTKKSYHICSNLLKLIMINGILFTAVAYYFIF
jgi:4-hydroxybenzoate polyprenyltransferase